MSMEWMDPQSPESVDCLAEYWLSLGIGAFYLSLDLARTLLIVLKM